MRHLPRLLFRLLVTGLVLTTAPAALAAASAARPNIVLFLADDLGYADLGCYGAKDIRTPAIDRLARDGLRFTHFYAGGTECSPTRTSLLTGQHPQRAGGLECAIGNGNVGRYDDAIRLRTTHDLGLPASDASLARMLKKAGYATALTGKWHLGYEDKFQPGAHGFDHAFYALGGGMDYFHHTEDPPANLPVLRFNGQPVKRDGYFTELVTEEAVRFIAAPRDGPFFLYVPFTAPHTPYQGPGDKLSAPLPADSPLWKQNNAPPAVYAAMIESMDTSVARILAELERRGLAGHTLVIFTSDNGGTRSARPAGLRDIKGTTFEGGIRVPGIVRWPGVLAAGTVSPVPGITMDLTASIVGAARAAAPAGHRFDGVDLLADLAAGRPDPVRPLYWRARRGESNWAAVRDGTLKYVRRTVRDATTVEGLFDLAADSAEAHDLLATRTADAARLRSLLAEWEVAVRPVR